MPQDMVEICMLIQVDYGNGQFFVRNQTVYYQGVKISSVNPTPLWSVGDYELYILSAVFPLECAYLVIVQSRYPAFYKCRKIKLENERIELYLTDGTSMSVVPFRDGVSDRLLIKPLCRI